MIFLEKQNSFVNHYYMYITELIQQICSTEGIVVDISLNTVTHIPKSIRVTINYEHTLVDSIAEPSFPKGTIPVLGKPSETYAVRMLGLYYDHSKSDIIIDYSCPNIKNLEFYPIVSKMVYIAPILYPICETQPTKTIDTLTTFTNLEFPRRQKLIDELGPNHINRNNCFEKDDLLKLYLSTKVLINVHQTEFHHTVEELRILPALACGVIVISEDSPLKETIPYYKSVIWVPYNEIVSKTHEVLENYESYREPLDRLKTLHEENYDRLSKKIKEAYIKMTSLDEISKRYCLDKNIATQSQFVITKERKVPIFTGSIMYKTISEQIVYSKNCHNYIPAYTSLFEPIRSSVKTLLEIGIGSIENNQMLGIIHTGYKTGNSLRCWRDYFPSATIHCIDIYPHTLNEPRITTYVADQSNTEQLSKVINSIDQPLDIIIDDGSHQGNHQVISFMYLEKYLSPSGIYVIEDVQPETIPGMQDLSAFPEDFRAYIWEKYDVELFDTREIAKKPDDFMISFKRKI
jgi:hypothetical protein